MKRLVVLLPACARGGWAGMTFQDAPGGGGHEDARPDGQQPIDAQPPDTGSCFIAGTPGMHLLLSEVCLSPSGSEFIEITNPTGATVDLSTYYLSDNGNYWKLP